MPKQQLFDFACEYRSESANAVLINDGTNDHWIPKSIAEWDPPLDSAAVNFTCTVPEWFAKKEGLC